MYIVEKKIKEIRNNKDYDNSNYNIKQTELIKVKLMISKNNNLLL